jgi:hypothetical protein
MSVPFGMIKDAGADGVACDLGKLTRVEEDALAEAVEAGLAIFAGAVPATGAVPGTGAAPAAGGRDARPGDGSAAAGAPRPPSARQTAERVAALWRRMGWPTARGGSGTGAADVAAQIVLTPACGMAGAAPGYAREAMARCREAARLLPELIEEGRA